MPLRGDVLAYKTSLSPSLCAKVLVSSEENERPCIYVFICSDHVVFLYLIVIFLILNYFQSSGMT